MKLTEEQFKALTPYRKHFETIVQSSWTRHPGDAALDLINGIYEKIIGRKNTLNKGCSHCIMDVMGSVGRIYLEDLEEREKVKVEVVETSADIPVKVEVKTETKPKRKYNRKPKTQD